MSPLEIYERYKSYLKSYLEDSVKTGMKTLTVNEEDKILNLTYYSPGSILVTEDTLVCEIIVNGQLKSFRPININQVLHMHLNLFGEENLKELLTDEEKNDIKKSI